MLRRTRVAHKTSATWKMLALKEANIRDNCRFAFDQWVEDV
jgi:hypothetical protein